MSQKGKAKYCLPKGRNAQCVWSSTDSGHSWTCIPLLNKKPVGGLDCNLPVGSVLCTTKKVAGTAVDFGSDPIAYLASKIKDAIASTLQYFAKVINQTSQVDWTNPGFLRTYTMMFGAATVVTMLLWLIGVVKRAVAGVHPVTAISESIGYLLISVVVTAFAPAVVYEVAGLFDAMANAMFKPVLGDITALEGTIFAAWVVIAALGGGQLFLTAFGLLFLFALVSVWVELVVRAALIYIALAFGPLVFSGLVDKSMWTHTRRWVGAVSAIIISKPVILVVLVLGTGLLKNANPGGNPVKAFAVFCQGDAIFFLAFLVPAGIAQFVPAFGDDLSAISASRQSAQDSVVDNVPKARSAAEEMASTTMERVRAVPEGFRQGVDDQKARQQKREAKSAVPKPKQDDNTTAPTLPGPAVREGQGYTSTVSGTAGDSVVGPAAPFVAAGEAAWKGAKSGVDRATQDSGGGGGPGDQGGQDMPPPDPPLPQTPPRPPDPPADSPETE